MKKILLFSATLFCAKLVFAQAHLTQSRAHKFAISSPFNHEYVTEQIFDEAKLCYNADTLVKVKMAGRAGLISATGRTVVPLEFDLIDDGAQTGMPIGVVGAKKGDIFSLWNVREGRKMVEGDFDWARAIYPDLLVGRRIGRMELEFFDEKGQKLFTLPGKTAWPGFDEASIKVFSGDTGEGVFFDRKGQVFFPEKFKNADWADASEVVVAEHDKNRMVVRSALLTAAGDTILATDSVYFNPIGGRQFFVQTVKRPQKMGLFDASERRWILPLIEQQLSKMGPKNDPASAIYSRKTEKPAAQLLFDANGKLIAEGFMTNVLRPGRVCAEWFKSEHRPEQYFVAVKNSTQNGLFAIDGRAILPMAFSKFEYASEAHPIIAEKALRYGDPNPTYNAFDLKTGQKLFADDFQELIFTANPRRFFARKNDRYGIIEIGKEAAARFEFDRLSAFCLPSSPVFTNFLFWGRKEGKYWVFGPDGGLDDRLVFDETYLPDQSHFDKFKAQKNRSGARLVALGRRRDQPKGYFYIDERGGQTFIADPTLGEMATFETDGRIEEVVVVEEPPMIEETPRPSREKIYDLSEVDEQPGFIGGRAAFADFVSKNKVVPPSALEKNLHGVVIVRAIIEKDGAIADDQLTIIQGLSPACVEEAKRLVMLLPNWSPAKLKGEAVRTKVSIPIEF